MAKTSRASWLKQAVAAARSGASLREICALSHAAARIRPLTEAEAERIVMARRQRNPPRDPIYVGAFDDDGPKISNRYADGDTAAVASPYKKGTWEVWIFGMIDPALGDSWNLAEKNLSRGAAIQRAHELTKF